MDGADGKVLLDEVICEIPEKFIQWRLTVNRWRDVEYLHLRKYYLDFEGDYKPSNEGACIPVNIQRISNLVSGLLKLLSDAEALHSVLEHVDAETLHRISLSLKEAG